MSVYAIKILCMVIRLMQAVFILAPLDPFGGNCYIRVDEVSRTEGPSIEA